MMIDHGKDKNQLAFLYDWMRIARKPNQSLHQDIKMLFQLIAIPVSESEIKIIEKAVDPSGKKTELSKEDLLNCFVIEEQSRKPKQKQLLKAFKHITKDQEDITFDQLRKFFQQEQIDGATTDMIIKQLSEYQNQNGRFDYKRFASTLY